MIQVLWIRLSLSEPPRTGNLRKQRSVNVWVEMDYLDKGYADFREIFYTFAYERLSGTNVKVVEYAPAVTL